MGSLMVRNALILAWTPIAAKNPRQIPYGERALTSAKEFGNWDLSLAKCRDFGRDTGSEYAASIGPSPVNRSVLWTGAS